MDPVIVRLTSEKQMKEDKIRFFETEEPGTETGKCEFVSLDDGGAMKLVFSPWKYISPFRFMFLTTEPDAIPLSHHYLRVTYMTEDESVQRLMWCNCKNRERQTIVPDTSVSKGRFVRSEVFDLTEEMIQRFHDSMKNMIEFYGMSQNSAIYLRELAFFDSPESAYFYYGDSPKADMDNSIKSKFLINGNSIDKYRIVVPEKLPRGADIGVKRLQEMISDRCGVELPIVSEVEPETECEILVGRVDRKESAPFYDKNNKFATGEADLGSMTASVSGSKLCMAYLYGYSLEMSIDILLYHLLYGGRTAAISDNDSFYVNFSTHEAYCWDKVPYVESPVHIKTKFEDNGSRPTEFYEDNGGCDWTSKCHDDLVCLENSTKNPSSPAFMHFFERNTDLSLKFMINDAEKGSKAVFRLRDSIPDAWVSAEYSDGIWSFLCNLGEDYSDFVLEKVACPVSEGEFHCLSMSLREKNLKVDLDGECLCSIGGVVYEAPGRFGIDAHGMILSVSDVDIALLGGQGRLIKNVEHTRLPDEEYREGGSMIVLSDGTWQYRHHSGASFNSKDNGKTWLRTEKWSQYIGGYCNVFRLSSGKLITIRYKEIDGVEYVVSCTSSDDAKTWEDGGIICTRSYPGSPKMHAGNMNDKFTQMSDGRIFYCQNYEGLFAGETLNNVFCEIYYSDDDGKSWTASKNDSRHMEGNRDELFGECKVMQSADRKLRVFCSWNSSPDVICSESDDNGKTWGEIRHITGLKCSRSSMQFCKDNYAENDCTYFAVLVYDNSVKPKTALPRSRLSLMRTDDGGISWKYLGDVVRRESFGYVCQLVDPFIQVTKEHIVVGTGLSGYSDFKRPHQAQRQHIFTFWRSDLTEYDEFPTTV